MIPPQVINHPSKHFSSRNGAPIRAIVLHHTAGTGSLDWLTENPAGVSTHVLITKAGVVYRMVPDAKAAHTVGFSNLGLYTISPNDRGSANQVTLNLELENTGSGEDPYPDAQILSAGWQIAQWWKFFGDLSVITHELIDTAGKTDPAGLDTRSVLSAALGWFSPLPHYTEDSPILGAPLGTLGQVKAHFPASPLYTAYDVNSVILPAYWEQALSVGVDPAVAVAQMAHETGALSSWWSDRPRRNPAGIGVTGDTSPNRPGPDWAWDGTVWRQGVSFADWVKESIPAHIGRLLAYVLTDEQATDDQYAYIKQALEVRPLPPKVRGSAQVLKQLGQVHNTSGEGWAKPGQFYGAAIASWANRLVGAV